MPHAYKNQPDLINNSPIASIERTEHSWVYIYDQNNGSIRSQTVEANLLFELLTEIRKLRVALQDKP